MRKYYILILLFLFGVGKINAADSLHNIGHASMKIKTSDGKVIYIDPFHGTSVNYSDSADIILVTHAHGDHNQVNLVTQKTGCTIISYTQSNINGTYQSFNVDGIKIYSVAAYNANHNINQCVGYVIEFNGIKLYHAGDTGNIPEMAELADSNITYALLPVDGVFNMSPEEATTAANNIQADYSIPMHTEPPPDDYNETIVARFTPANKLLVRNGETIALVNSTTDVKEGSEIPLDFKLYQSYPNPFNPSTSIQYAVSTPANGTGKQHVIIKVYDVEGKEVATLVNEEKEAGIHTVTFSSEKINGMNSRPLSSGIYFYKMQAGSFTDTKKLLLLK
jgi:L-ascorbate metabolism protein UlaG (beta-lactamase superfamily)